jgi:N-acetyl-alpha-D-glucosaminyl L-malate synthase BshA
VKSVVKKMTAPDSLKIGITCYPTVGGSGILAAELGAELVARGHEVHFISYEKPFRLPAENPRVFFHPVTVNTYGLFKYPDYTLPLSVRMAEVARDQQLDILHVHYAVPHATAAILAREMLPAGHQLRIVTTLHGTDTTLLGRDPGYGPAIRHALERSDAITAVSEFLRRETINHLGVQRPIEVIHNFFEPEAPARPRDEVRRELGLGDEAMILHISNLRPVKRIDLLLEAAARIRPADAFKLVIIAGESFTPFEADVRRLGLEGRVIVRERINRVEDYLQAADLALFSSETESFCLGILEAMCFGVPSVSTAVGGIPEVIDDGVTGQLVPFGNADALAQAAGDLIADPARRKHLGAAARIRAGQLFSPDRIVTRYLDLYDRVMKTPKR